MVRWKYNDKRISRGAVAEWMDVMYFYNVGIQRVKDGVLPEKVFIDEYNNELEFIEFGNLEG